jgi:D-alanyl-D-alanine carboxypeptidase
MAILARHLMTDFPNQFAYFSKTEFPFRGVMIKGHNHFMEKYDGADGLKTGYTFASGFNLAASARRGDTRLIAVVFGGASAKQRDDHMAQLMDAGFSVLQQRPDAIAVAQKVDPFPALVASAAAATIPNSQPTGIVAASQVDDETLVAASGDAEDAIGQQIMTDAPPLTETAALVPAPGTLTAKGKAMAARSGTLRAKPVSVPPTTASVTAAPTSSWGIQIGAYVNRLQAESQATAAAGKIRAAIAAAAPRVISVKVSAQKTLYRAQVIGLDRKDTAKACKLAGSAAGCKPVGPDQKTVAMR